MWKEDLGIPYYLYFLIDPRKNKVCYVGLTKQKFKLRLLQHRNPKHSNEASIAKLQRHLKTIGLTLQGEVMAKGSKELIEALERYYISGFRLYNGKSSIKNHQIGGLTSFGQDPESKIKAWKTKAEKEKKGLYIKKVGEDSSASKLTENQVLAIYDMIKKFYANSEIIEQLGLEIGITGVCQIRSGRTWEHLFKKQNMINIPSLNVVKGALGSQQKLKILSMIEEGEDNKTIQSLFKIGTTDLNRIRDKTLWKMPWNVYTNFMKKQTNI